MKVSKINLSDCKAYSTFPGSICLGKKKKKFLSLKGHYLCNAYPALQSNGPGKG